MGRVTLRRKKEGNGWLGQEREGHSAEDSGAEERGRSRRGGARARERAGEYGWLERAGKLASKRGYRGGGGEGLEGRGRAVPWREPEDSKLRNSNRQNSAGGRTTRV